MNALYYPFHLCHERTLEHLLEKYQMVHFREFMALQLTPMMGTTAFPDRMGDYHPELLKLGRIAQGHNLSGAMAPEIVFGVNRDLADAQWRNYFHKSMLKDRRFQHGLFGDPNEGTTGPIGTSSKPEWLQFRDMAWVAKSFEVKTIQALSHHRLHEEKAAQFEYGWALLKTSASLIYTIQLCRQLNLIAVTDSEAHHHLLAQTCEREEMALENIWVKREGY